MEGSNNKVLSAVLELSFESLPAYLKPCFMYLGIFPQDLDISTQRLYHLWEAESLINITTDGILRSLISEPIGAKVYGSCRQTLDKWNDKALSTS